MRQKKPRAQAPLAVGPQQLSRGASVRAGTYCAMGIGANIVSQIHDLSPRRHQLGAIASLSSRPE